MHSSLRQDLETADQVCAKGGDGAEAARSAGGIAPPVYSARCPRPTKLISDSSCSTLRVVAQSEASYTEARSPVAADVQTWPLRNLNGQVTESCCETGHNPEVLIGRDRAPRRLAATIVAT